MVNTARRPGSAFALPTVPTRLPPYTVVETKPEAAACPRCSTRLYAGYDEMLCIVCGFADYSYTTEGLGKPSTNVVSSATRHVLRYVGDFPTLSQTLAHAHLVRVRNRAMYAVKCPFCHQSMERSSLSGKRPDVREERYRCQDGHRVSLIPTRSGKLGWK